MARNLTYTASRDNTQGTPAKAFGKVSFPADAIVAADYIEIQVGFRPKKVTFVNLTDRITAEHFDGMAANSCLKTAANGTRTLEVNGGNGGITLTSSGFQLTQNATLAVVAASKDCYWVVEG